MKAPLTFVAVALLLSGNPALGGEPKNAFPKGNPGEWVNSSDYPSAALREEIEGITRFQLTIDDSGMPTECTVTASSGNDALDATTCALLVERGTFHPAEDGSGKPMAGIWSSSVRWEIPSDSNEVPPAHSTRISYVVDIDGSVRDCRADTSLGAGANQICAGIIAQTFDPPLNAKGEPEAVRVIMTSEVKREPVGK